MSKALLQLLVKHRIEQSLLVSAKQNLWRKQVIMWLESNVSPNRINHILGVEATCIHLAKCHQIPEKKAAKAGLLHDLAKFFPPDQLLRIARKAGIKIDEISQQHPHLLHADVSAVVAQQEFGVKSPKILDAIKNHTLGNPEMSSLSCIVYIADKIEPNRGNTNELNRLREIATDNLYQGVWETSDYTLQYLVSDRKLIHPRTVLTRNWALRKVKKTAS